MTSIQPLYGADVCGSLTDVDVNRLQFGKNAEKCEWGENVAINIDMEIYEMVDLTSTIPLSCLLPCNNCGKIFYTEKDKNRHIKQTHGERNFICDECNEGFKMKQHVKKHLLKYYNCTQNSTLKLI